MTDQGGGQVERNGSPRRKKDRDLLERLEALQKALVGAAIGYLILLVFVAGALWDLEKRADDKIVHTQVAACERVNILRTQVNTLALIAYRAFKVGYDRELRLSQTLPQAERGPHIASVHSLASVLGELKVTDLTDCAAAGSHPDSYIPPKPHAIPNP